MHRLAKAAVIFFLAVVVLLGASGFVIRALVSGSAKDALLNRLSQSAGAKVQVESVDFDVAAWYRLRPAIELRGVRLGNPPGYKGADLLTAGSIETEVALGPLLSGSVEVHGLTVRQPRFYVEAAKSGVTNIEAFLKQLSGPKGDSAAQPKQDTGPANGSLSIQRIEVSQGEIYSSGKPLLRGIDLVITGYAADRASKVRFASRLFGGTTSRMQLEGMAGPVSPTAVPLDARLTLNIAPSEIPADVRKRELGDLLAHPPAAARVAVTGALKGELYTLLTGSASIAITGMEVGPDPERRLPLEGEVPASLSIRRLMSTPVIQADIRNATMRLGSGTWKGNVQLLSVGGVIRGTSNGSISGVNINEFLTAFASSPNKISGKLTLPSYTLRFAGRDADQIKSSLSGEGRLELADGQVKMLDLLSSIQRAINGQPKDRGAAGQTEFTTFTTDLRIAEQQLNLSNMILAGPALNARGDGTIGFDQTIAMQIRALVSGRIAELLGRRSQEGKPAEAEVPVVVSQTVANPLVRPDLGKIAAGAAKSYLGEFLKKQFGKKSDNKQQ